METTIAIKRIYEEPSPEDGYRVLIDRLWPRGITKQKAQLDEWNKDLAPSSSLREWYHHNRENWTVFADKYRLKLVGDDLGKAFLERLANEKKITLLFAAKDVLHSHSVVLQKYLEDTEKSIEHL